MLTDYPIMKTYTIYKIVTSESDSTRLQTQKKNQTKWTARAATKLTEKNILGEDEWAWKDNETIETWNVIDTLTIDFFLLHMTCTYIYVCDELRA